MLTSASTDVRQAAGRATRQPAAPMLAGESNVISMLIEALTCPDKYEITERGGELFVKPIAAGKAAVLA